MKLPANKFSTYTFVYILTFTQYTIAQYASFVIQMIVIVPVELTVTLLPTTKSTYFKIILQRENH